MLTRFITGVAGHTLTRCEERFLAEARPCGLILFARNCSTPDQVSALIEQFRTAVGHDDLIISIDQEGGRVQRLRPPFWRELPSAHSYSLLCGRDWQAGLNKLRLASHLVAQELRALGINTNMVPVLDVPVPGAHEIISDRAFGCDPASVAALGRVVAEGHMAGGVLPVMKHIPGHGRAKADSHEELPVVDASMEQLQRDDFAPFRELKDLPAAMTAHVVYQAIDPDYPASISRAAHDQVIRGDIGFNGLLMSDDLSMKALKGDFGDRVRAVVTAGSDLVLHCNGHLDEMEAIAAAVPGLTGSALERFQTALQVTNKPEPVDILAAEAVIAESLSLTP